MLNTVASRWFTLKFNLTPFVRIDRCNMAGLCVSLSRQGLLAALIISYLSWNNEWTADIVSFIRGSNDNSWTFIFSLGVPNGAQSLDL